MLSVPRIVAVFGPCRGVVREVDASLLVGRAAEAAFQLIDEKVSREHCRIGVDGAGVAVEDLGSRNGTYVNGSRIETARLEAGDRLQVGRVELVALRDAE